MVCADLALHHDAHVAETCAGMGSNRVSTQGVVKGLGHPAGDNCYGTQGVLMVVAYRYWVLTPWRG